VIVYGLPGFVLSDCEKEKGDNVSNVDHSGYFVRKFFALDGFVHQAARFWGRVGRADFLIPVPGHELDDAVRGFGLESRKIRNSESNFRDMDVPCQFIYTITTGRSGTKFLSRLLNLNIAGAEVHHEFTGFPHFGRRTPDVSHLTTFNHVGNVPEVRSFWRRKFTEDSKSRARVYAEMSHVLAKAGLLENLDRSPPATRIDLIRLKRDSFETYWSHLNRFDFVHPASTWLFALDAHYPNVIIDATPYLNHGIFGQALWYVHEMEARAGYYERLMVTDSRVRVHRILFEDMVTPFGASTLLQGLGHRCDPAEVELPHRANMTRSVALGEADRSLAEHLHQELACETGEAGERFFEEGLRLGAPVHLFLQGAAHLHQQPLPPPILKAKAVESARVQNLKLRGLSGGAGDVGLSG